MKWPWNSPTSTPTPPATTVLQRTAPMDLQTLAHRLARLESEVADLTRLLREAGILTLQPVEPRLPARATPRIRTAADVTVLDRDTRLRLQQQERVDQAKRAIAEAQHASGQSPSPPASKDDTTPPKPAPS